MKVLAPLHAVSPPGGRLWLALTGHPRFHNELHMHLPDVEIAHRFRLISPGLS